MAIHELGHAFHNQGGLNMQWKWMGELFANILLHTYIAEKSRIITCFDRFPQMVVFSTNKSELKFTTVNEQRPITNYLVKISQNYGWYQCRWLKPQVTSIMTEAQRRLKTMADIEETKRAVR
ncbi:MAG: hypothetical protein IPL22_22515 [Bacteroidetes bacterium]|nr:hypothetical protein [Bacteroidota bacterium]